MPLFILGENNDSETPTTDDLKEWADNYGITSPVLADAGWATAYAYNFPGGLPYRVLMDQGVEIVDEDMPDETDIAALLDE